MVGTIRKYILFLGAVLITVVMCCCSSINENNQNSFITDATTEAAEKPQSDYVSADDMINRGHERLLSEFMSEVSIGYANKDGSKTLYVFAQPINYMNEYMEWTPIDTDIKEVDEEYRTTLINFAKYKLVMFAMAKLMEMESTEQNKVALYLFNNI